MKGSAAAGRFFEREDQRCIPGVEFNRCSSSEWGGQSYPKKMQIATGGF